MSSGELEKYKCSTGEDLGYKTGVYSRLGKVFNKGLEKQDKKERLSIGLKNFEDINKKQLETNKNHLKMI